MTQQRAPHIQRGIVDFMIANDLLRFQLETALRPLGINLTQMSLLNHFAWRPEQASTITQLTEVMAINQPGVTKAVGALVEKGIMEKIDSAEDARVKLVKITGRGLALLDQARIACYPSVEAAFSGLDDTELVAFTHSLNKMKNYLAQG